MATVSNTKVTWICTLHATAPYAASAWVTGTVNITQEWGIKLPIAWGNSTASADAPVYVFRSMDGGANYDTLNNPWMARAIARLTHDNVQRISLELPTGQYAVVINTVAGAANYTCSIGVYTAQVLTAYVGN